MGKLGKWTVLWLLLLAFGISAAAAGHCAVTVELPGGSLTLYRVDASFSGTPQQMAEYAKNNAIPGTTKTLKNAGAVRFDGLEPGQYLLVQWEAAEGYYPVRPFLVELGEDSPEVYAKPKQEKQPEWIPDTGDSGWLLPLAVSGSALTLLVIWLRYFRGWKKRKT